MKIHLLPWAGWVFIGGLLTLATTAEEAVRPAFLIHFPASMESTTTARLQRALDRNSDLAVLSDTFTEDSMGEVMRQALSNASQPALGHIIVWLDEHSKIPDVLSMPTNRVALLQIKTLSSPDQEKFMRRIERYLSRAAAQLGGVPPCPLPQCCLHTRSKGIEIDQLGINPCPPCRFNLINRAGEQGVRPLDPRRFMPKELREKMMQPQIKEAE